MHPRAHTHRCTHAQVAQEQPPVHLERTQSPCEVKLTLCPQREATTPLRASASSSAAQRGKQPTAQGSPEVGCCKTDKMPRVLSGTRSVLNNRSLFLKARCRCFLPPFWCLPSTSRLLPVKTRFPGYKCWQTPISQAQNLFSGNLYP